MRCQNIKKARIKCGYTQEEVAEKIGVTTMTYRRWENKDVETFGMHFVALSKLFGVSTDYLLGVTENYEV